MFTIVLRSVEGIKLILTVTSNAHKVDVVGLNKINRENSSCSSTFLLAIVDLKNPVVLSSKVCSPHDNDLSGGIAF
jgi:hypothetical protein